MTQPIASGACQRFAPGAADLRSGRVPDHLRELLIEAPYQAAEQVFETALAEDADAVLLAGDVLNVDRAGPPAIVLLLDQFARLGDRGIPVYWAGGAVDLPDLWPRSVALPENVHVFPVGRVETLDLVRGGETIARVQGTSCREDGEVEARGFHRDAHGLFTIGVAYGTSDSPGHEGDRVHYMALGGRHAQQTVDEQPGIAHYCGTPQGRGPTETGPHGCTVVTVDDSGRAKTRFVATDAVRWSEQALEVTASTRSEQLHERMVERLEKLQAQQPGHRSLCAVDHSRHRSARESPAAGRTGRRAACRSAAKIRRAFARRVERFDRMRVAAERAGRVVRPGNVPRRFPAAGSRVRIARRYSARPAAVPARRPGQRCAGGDCARRQYHGTR